MHNCTYYCHISLFSSMQQLFLTFHIKGTAIWKGLRAYTLKSITSRSNEAQLTLSLQADTSLARAASCCRNCRVFATPHLTCVIISIIILIISKLSWSSSTSSSSQPSSHRHHYHNHHHCIVTTQFTSFEGLLVSASIEVNFSQAVSSSTSSPSHHHHHRHLTIVIVIIILSIKQTWSRSFEGAFVPASV